mgnify:CR=1 FL=1
MKLLTDYQKKVVAATKYKQKIIYPALGLVAESVNFITASGGKWKSEQANDCFFYVFLLTNDLKFDIHSIYDAAMEKDGFLYDDITEAEWSVIRSSANICEYVRRSFNEGNCGSGMSDDTQFAIEFELTAYLSALIYVCDALGVQWREILKSY